MTMINSLTEAQIAQFPKYVEEYKAIGLNTNPIDFDKATKVMKDFLGNDAKHHKFVYVTSPHQIPREAKMITYGNMESYWVAFYKFFYDNFQICAEIEEMMPILNECSWVYADEKNVYISERPNLIKFDDENRTHSETGPAISYADGFSVYMWHGIRVPGWWIETPEKLTEKEFFQHENAEMRRVACEIVGWSKVLSKLRAKVIDEDADPEIGTLIEVNIPEIGKERFLKVLCGTRREFAMPVPPEMKTAIQAQAWMLGFDDVNEFMLPEIRT